MVYFDTETTGLNCFSCNVIELAMLSVEFGDIIDEYDKFIRVGRPLPQKIINLTGIDDDMLNTQGEDERTVAQDLKKRIEWADIMIAHNAQFDLSFIYNMLRRHFPDEVEGLVRNVSWIDTLTVVKDRKKYPHRLDNVVEYYDIGEFNFHRAIDDTRALYKVTREMKKERDDLKKYCNVFGFNPKYGVSGINFKFIQYKSQDFHNWKVDDDKILPLL